MQFGCTAKTLGIIPFKSDQERSRHGYDPRFQTLAICMILYRKENHLTRHGRQARNSFPGSHALVCFGQASSLQGASPHEKESGKAILKD